MSAEANQQTALKYFQLCGERNKPYAAELLTDDCQWWAPGFGTMGRTQFDAIVDQMRPMMPDIPKMEILGVTAQGDRVAVETRGHCILTNGKAYNNQYHFLFIFRGGRICMVKEYTDAKYATEVMSG